MYTKGLKVNEDLSILLLLVSNSTYVQLSIFDFRFTTNLDISYLVNDFYQVPLLRNKLGNFIFKHFVIELGTGSQHLKNSRQSIDQIKSYPSSA